jgi:hypothetical protein
MALQGFPDVQAISIQSLHQLVRENWLGESVLDARMQLLAHEVNTIGFTTATPFLIRFLPCYFHSELIISFSNRRLTPTLIRYREEILANPPTILGFLLNKNDEHWAPAAVLMSLRTVLQGDSYGYPPHDNLLEMIQWWLQDTVPEDGAWTTADLVTPQQYAGSGSCGLAAVTALVSLARSIDSAVNEPRDTTVPLSSLWTHKTSSRVRAEWIGTLIRHHIITVDLHPVSHVLFIPTHFHSYSYR